LVFSFFKVLYIESTLFYNKCQEIPFSPVGVQRTNPLVT